MACARACAHQHPAADPAPPPPDPDRRAPGVLLPSGTPGPAACGLWREEGDLGMSQGSQLATVLGRKAEPAGGCGGGDGTPRRRPRGFVLCSIASTDQPSNAKGQKEHL
jgi:hypothetical protein